VTETPLTLISFGYLHGQPPEADVTIDVRIHFKDPHVNPELRHLDATSARVCNTVLGTPGIAALTGSLVGVAEAYLAGPSPAPVTIAVGCAGGRHRSAVIADLAGKILAARGARVRVVHRDIALPVVDRPAGTPEGGEDR
jgi:UPF0042 nucleotide-binding protein